MANNEQDIKTGTGGRRVLKNAVFGFSTWFLPLGLSIVATPVIVRNLGHEDYGIYAFVLGFIAYSFNFNTGRAVTKYVAELNNSGDRKQIGEIISATLIVNLSLGIVAVAGVFLVARPLVVNILKIQPDAQEKTLTALYLASLTIFFLMLQQVFNAVLQGLQRFDVYAKLFNLNTFASIGGNLTLALAGFGLNAILGWNLLATAAAAALTGFFAMRMIPDVKLRLHVPRETFGRVFSYSAWIVIYQILANVLLLFERGWITAKLGPEALTFYVVPMSLALYIHSFVASLMLIVFPLASELANEPERLRALYLKATKIGAFVAALLSVVLVAERDVFLRLWVGAEFAERSSTILVLHSITFGMLAAGVAMWQLAEGLGRPHYNAIAFVICFIVSILGMLELTGAYGAVGVAFARLIGFGLLFPAIFVFERMVFGRIDVRFWLRLVLVLSVAGIAAGLAAKAVNVYVDGLPGFLTAGATATIVFAIVAFVGGLADDEERRWVKSLLGIG